MPEMECQAYWHEMPEPALPWSLEPAAELRPRAERPALRTKRGVTLDEGLTPTGAINEVLVALRCTPLQAGEIERALTEGRAAFAANHSTAGRGTAAAAAASQRPRRIRVDQPPSVTPVRPTTIRAESAASSVPEDPRVHVDDPPLLRALRSILGARGILMETAERRTSGEQLTRQNFFEAYTTAVFIVDRERPQFVAAYGADGPKASCMVNVMVPMRDPVPFRMHVTQLDNISRNECLVLKCWAPEDRAVGSPTITQLFPQASPAPAQPSAAGQRRPRGEPSIDVDMPGRAQPSAEIAHTPAAWAAVPAVEASQKTRLKRSIKLAWYHRLMATTTRRIFRTVVASRFANTGDSDGSDD